MQALNNFLNLILVCLGLHFLADFVLQIQGHLHELKQKSWWDQQLSGKAERLKKLRETILYGITQVTDNNQRADLAKKFVDFVNLADTEVVVNTGKYKYDYLCGLLCHSFMWSIVTFIPLMFLVDPKNFAIAVILNTIVHAVVDNIKANHYMINLWTDQLLHIAQIVVTVMVV